MEKKLLFHFSFIDNYKWDLNDISTTEAWFPFQKSGHILTFEAGLWLSLLSSLSNKWWEISVISLNFATVADLWCKSACASETLRDTPNRSSQTLHCRQNAKMFSAVISKLPCQTRTRASIVLATSVCDPSALKAILIPPGRRHNSSHIACYEAGRACELITEVLTRVIRDPWAAGAIQTTR